MSKTLAQKTDIAFLALWMALLLAAPGLKASSALFGWPAFADSALAENRRRTPRPRYRELPPRQWGKATEKWYGDNFAGRKAVIGFYKDLHFRGFKSPLKDNVPGVGGWIFGRGGTWPEVEDYMGAIKMDDRMVDDWKTLFEGRVAWAEAHGSHYLEIIAPMKAHIHPEKMLPMITAHRKESYREDLRRALARSPACSNVFFLVEPLAAEVAAGREVYYEEDHHENAYGCYCVFREIVGRMRDLWYPDLPDFPFYDAPVPQEVLDRRAPGCWVDGNRRLVVSNPGAHVADYPRLHISAACPKFPHSPVFIRQPGPRRFLVICHDSFLRYPFSTWYDRENGAKDFALPVGAGFDRIASLIFTRITPPRLDGYFAQDPPDVLVEQFSEGRLQFGPVGLDETMRRAAAWGRGEPVARAADATNGLMAAAVLENLRSSPPKQPVAVELRDASGAAVAVVTNTPGVRRVAFFGRVPAAEGLRPVLVGGAADEVRLELRQPKAEAASEAPAP